MSEKNYNTIDVNTEISNILSIEREKRELENKKKTLNEALSKAKSRLSDEDEAFQKKREIEEEIRVNKQIEELVRGAQNELKSLSVDIQEAHEVWVNIGTSLFKKAAIAHVCITVYTDGFWITTDDNRPGLYGAPSTNAWHNKNKTGGLPFPIKKDLMERSKAIVPIWSRLVETNKKYWERANELRSQDLLSWKDSNATCEDCNTYLNDSLTYLYETNNKHENDIRNLNLSQYDDVERNINEAERAIRENDEQIEKANKQIHDIKLLLAENDPIMAGFTIPKSLHKTMYDDSWMRIVSDIAARRGVPEYLPDYSYFPWSPGRNTNFYAAYCVDFKASQTNSKRNIGLEYLLTVLLLAYPVGQIHITVIEQSKGAVSPTFERLSKTGVIDIVSARPQDINAVGDRLARIFSSNPEVQYKPREIVVLVGYDDDFNRKIDQYKDYIKEGNYSGIYFITIPGEEYVKENDSFIKYFSRYTYLGVSNHDILNEPAQIKRTGSNGERIVDGTFSELMVQYFEEATAIGDNPVYEQIADSRLYTVAPIRDLQEQNQEDKNQIVVPFAQASNGEEIFLRFDAKQNFHTLIIGKSGSGKSYMLQSILTNLMLKYDPSVVDIILMDFKAGGVELNHYKDVPHVSKLVVNGADRQMVNEIMRSLQHDMKLRGERFKDKGVENIDKYNNYIRTERENGNREALFEKHTIVLIDECQCLFENDDDTALETVISIAKQGRSQGVHLVFASQTIAGIPRISTAMKQFTDFLFMQCTSDDVEACNIAADSSVKMGIKQDVSALKSGNVICCSNGRLISGRVYDYSGENEKYSRKTFDVLKGETPKYQQIAAKFKGKQFYVNSSQRVVITDQTLEMLDNNLSTIPIACVGRDISVKGNALSMKFLKRDGYNLLITGYNAGLQAERCLWNGLLSLIYSCRSINDGKNLPHDDGEKTSFVVLNNLYDSEDIEEEAQADIKQRNRLLQSIHRCSKGDNVIFSDNIAKEIEEISSIVRHRNKQKDTDSAAIFLVIPNAELVNRDMLSKIHKADIQENPSTKDTKSNSSGIDWGGIAVGNSSRDSYDYNSYDNQTVGDLLKEILEDGPSVNVHIIMQVSGINSIFTGDYKFPAGDVPRLFRNIIVFRTPEGPDFNSLPTPLAIPAVKRLNTSADQLRALTITQAGDLRWFIPYDFPNDSIINKMI